MIDLLLSPPYLPFSLALGLLFGLLLLEVLAQIVGFSVLGEEAPDADIAMEAEVGGMFDFEPGEMPDVDALLDAADGLDGEPPVSAAPAGSVAAITGLGRVPFLIWFAALLLAFGLSGLALQSVLEGTVGFALTGMLASLPALFAGLWFARTFSGAFARILPQTETTATRTQFMGGLRGVVSQGTARRGMAAEVRLKDRHGNLHYQRCEPFRDEDVIAEGSEVLTVRERRGPDDWGLRIIPISAA